MADRDLHELLDLAMPAQLTAGGMSGGPGMRWHPRRDAARSIARTFPRRKR